MKIYLLLISLIFPGLKCSERIPKDTQNKMIAPVASAKRTIDGQFSWYDSLVADYIQKSNNDLIKHALKDGIEEEWLLDRIDDSTTTKYFAFQIGHDLEDSDGKRFVTDAWISIDSVKRKVFELSPSADSLIEWKR